MACSFRTSAMRKEDSKHRINPSAGDRMVMATRPISPLGSLVSLLPVNGAPAGAELKGQGSFVTPGIFAIPLQTPIGNLPTQHLTASVADVQGNTNVVTVRFRVDAGFRILSLDPSALSNQRLTLRFENPSRATNHIVLWVDDLSKPAGAWTTLNVLNAVDEPDQARRLEVELPGGVPGNLFLRVQKP
jgi:hypothetical protein